MSRRHIDRLRRPAARYDLARIMAREVCPTRSEGAGRAIITGFETKAMSRAEDTKRVALAEVSLRRFPTQLNAAWVKALIAALSYEDGSPPHSRASSLRSRQHRRFLGGAVLKLIESCGMPVKAFTLLSEEWVVPSNQLTPVRVRRLMKQVRNHLDRLGDARGRGFVVAGLDGEYDEAIQAFVIHLHGILGGDRINAFDRIMRTRQAYVPSNYIARPLRLAALKDPAKQVSYIIKAFWRSSNSDTPAGTGMHPRRMRRIPEPYGTLYLSVLNQLSISDTIIMSGVIIRNGHLHVR